MKRLSLWILILVAVGWAIPSPAQTLQFSQIDFNLDGNFTPDSGWGAVDFTFTGSNDVLYFNLSVNGTWQVLDMPVLTTEDVGTSQTQRFTFDLGVPDGVDVSSLNYGYTLTTAPTGVMPPSTVSAAVLPDAYEVYASGGTVDFPTTPGTAGPTQGSTTTSGSSAVHKNFPNQQAGPRECAPTAVSNSCKFLKAKHGLPIADSSISIAKMKTAVGFIAGWGSPRDTFWSNKKAYMKAHKIPITTKKVEKADIAKIIPEIKDGQDVEMEIFGHTVAVTGIKDLGGGKYSVTVAHDKKQSDPNKGNVTETATYDKSTGKWSGALKMYKGINYFVVECPLPKKDTQKTQDTAPAGTNKITPGASTGAPEIPADFFGPGSEPFNFPIPDLKPKKTGSGDDDSNILFQRYGTPILYDLPLGESADVEVELTDLDLVSDTPITVNYVASPPEEWDAELTLTELVEPDTGLMTVDKTEEFGGFFNGVVYVRPKLIFTRVSDGEIRIFDPLEMDPGTPPLELPLVDGRWVYSVAPGSSFAAPNDGHFVWGVEQMNPGDPFSQVPHPMVLQDADGALRLEIWPAETTPTGVSHRPDPRLFVRSYPNPFNPTLTIEYDMSREGQLELAIYSLRGQKVRTLVSRVVPGGVGSVLWDGRDDQGRQLASGVYLYEAKALGSTISKKVTLVK